MKRFEFSRVIIGLRGNHSRNKNKTVLLSHSIESNHALDSTFRADENKL